MGYQSSFSITAKLHTLPPGIKDAKVDLNYIQAALKDVVSGESFFIRNNQICTDSDAVWYDEKEDLTKLSLSLPGILLTCIRHGEESGDVACTYYFNGKNQRAVMTFSEFNETE